LTEAHDVRLDPWLYPSRIYVILRTATLRETRMEARVNNINGAIEAANSKLEWNSFDFQPNITYISVLHQG
jgi:hypothetical protein